ncbi:MAG: DUF5686 family protein [Crocinitomicaceae bacterium]|nr:DUF5686 family protein [Crocinitomicaceae bacterium]
MKIATIIAFLAFAITVFSQDKVQIKDARTLETIPFVKISFDNQASVLADIDGYFTIDLKAVKSIKLKTLGYLDSTISTIDITNNEIFLDAEAMLLDEVKILPGENPAHRIMDQVIANRKKNSPLANNAFEYNSYSKFYFTMDPTALEQIPAETEDSSLIQIRNLFTSQYLFLMESSSTRKFMPPNRDNEVITAYKVSGFKDPMFSTFANEMQSFSFYDNQFELMGKAYINPIALGGTRRYLFLMEDTTVVGLDTTFTISYRPRKGKNFDGLKGQLFINTNGWAIEKVISEPNEPGDAITIRVVQEYQFIDGKKWFPKKLSSEISMPIININSELKNSSIIGKGNTYVDNMVLDPDLRKRDFKSVAIETERNADRKSDNHWDSTRVYNLTDQERKTYQVIDSISKENRLEMRLKLLMALADAKLPLGNVNLDLLRLANYNMYEGFRLGLGLETSEKLMKRATVGGYFAWATSDKDWKYGGFADFKIYPRNDFKLHLKYQQDVEERGGDRFSYLKDGVNINSMLRNLYSLNKDRKRLAEVALSGYVVPTMKLAVFGNYQRLYYTEGYQFARNSVLEPSQVDLSEVGLEFSWHFREKIIQLGNKRISKGSKFPKLKVRATHGIAGVFDSKYDYLRLNAALSQDVSLRGFGNFIWVLSASKTEGSVPLFLLHTGNATGVRWRLTVPNTFETMEPSRFYNDQQVSLFTRVRLLAWKTKKSWFEPQLSVHHAIGFGTMKNQANHPNTVFETMEKGYYEGGIILDNLLVSSFFSIGAGIFSNYGPYSVPKFDKNMTIKFSINFKM